MRELHLYHSMMRVCCTQTAHVLPPHLQHQVSDVSCLVTLHSTLVAQVLLI